MSTLYLSISCSVCLVLLLRCVLLLLCAGGLESFLVVVVLLQSIINQIGTPISPIYRSDFIAIPPSSSSSLLNAHDPPHIVSSYSIGLRCCLATGRVKHVWLS